MSDSETSMRDLPSRREFISLGVGAMAVALTPGLLRRRPRLVRRTVPVMGTTAELAVSHREPRYAHAAIDAAIAELRAVETTMSRFRADSDVGRANGAALAGPVPISLATATVLSEALDWARTTGGTFDPCLGAAMALWDFEGRDAPPAVARVRPLAGRRLYRFLELEEPGGSDGDARVRFHDPDVAIDLGGIAKGYGVDRAVRALRSFGILNGLVNVGGDLYALGRSPDGNPWKVGVRSPRRPDRLIGTIDVEEKAVATSGDYLQFFESGGRRYHHLLDPATGAPRSSTVRSLTVTADACLTADAAATAAFGLPADGAARLLRSRAPDARVAWIV